MDGVGKEANGWTGREGLGRGAARIRKRVSNDRKSRGFSPTELVLRNRLRPRRLYTCRYGKCKIVLGRRRNRKHRSMMPANTGDHFFARIVRLVPSSSSSSSKSYLFETIWLKPDIAIWKRSGEERGGRAAGFALPSKNTTGCGRGVTRKVASSIPSAGKYTAISRISGRA